MLESRNTTPLKKPSQNEDFPNSHLKKYKVTLPSKTERNKVLSSQYLADNVKDGDVYSYTENNCDILLIDFNGQQKWQSNVENVVFGQRNGFLGKMHGSMESTIQQNECEIINLKDWQNKNESLVIETRKIVQDIKNQSNGQHDHELISLVPSTNPQARTLISSLAPVQNDPHQQQDSALTSSLLLLPNEPQRQQDPVSISPPVFVPNIRQLQQDPFVFVFKRQHELNEKFINIKDDISYPTEEENEDFEFEHHPKTLASYEIWIQGVITRYERDQSISDKDFEMFEYYEKKLFGRGTQVQAANRKKRSRPFSDAADYRLKNIHLTIPEENKQNMPDPILVRLGHMFHGVKSMLTRK